MNILSEFDAGALAAARKNVPDTLLLEPDPTPWPALDGVVGVFFTSRTGSTALMRIAESNFELGQVEESLNAEDLLVRTRKRAFDTLQQTLKWYIRQTSGAGWFMFKAGVPGLMNAARIGFLEEYGAIIRPVFLLRRDILGQALSLFVAQHTRRFHSTQEAQRELTEQDYDPAALETLMAIIRGANSQIAHLLPFFAFPPQVLFYEEFSGGDETRAIDTFAAAGLPRRDEPRLNPRRVVHKITHPLTAQFRERFMAGLSERGAQLLADHDRFIADWQAQRDAAGRS